MPKLVILDGNSLLYRGFFAMRYLSTSDGTPTNAVHTFVNMLLLILEREKPDAIFAAFDPPVATFRHIEMESYKANRKETPDDLKPQRALAREAARVFNVPVVEVEGFEADDVCGTLAAQGKALGYEVLIVTGDGDALQLVDDAAGPVRVMITVKGVTDTVLYDEAAVVARYGLSSNQIPDFKGLKGDSSDNLPGVPGIGEKGASKLLQAYGTVENLLEHTDELADKLKNTLNDNREIALQCKRLATIVCDVPLPEWVDLTPDHQAVGPDFPAVREFFERMEFKALLKKLPNMEAAQRAKSIGSSGPQTAMSFDDASVESAPEPGAKLAVEHHTVSQATELAALVEALDKANVPVGLTLHTSTARGPFMDANLLGVSVAVPEAAYYVAWSDVSDELRGWLEDAGRPKVVHDLKFTAGVLSRQDIAINGVDFDTLLAAYLLNAGRSSYPIAGLAEAHLGLDLVADPEDPISDVMDEAAVIQRLAAPMRAKLEADGLAHILDDLEIPLSLVIARMEREGVRVDCDLMRGISAHLGEQMATLEAEIYELAGMKFAIALTKQLQEVLFEKLGLPAGKKTKTGYSTGAEVLEALAAKGFEIASKIVSWREVSKLKSTYADTLPGLVHCDTGKLHTTLSQTTASTGRLSSSNPNLQNIPIRTEVGREIRKAFVAEPGCVLVSADYSQIELRIFAQLSKDTNLVQAFVDESDVHERTARLIFGIAEGEPVTSDQRRQAKTINFAVIYGAGPFRVSSELGIPQAQASELINAYLSSYPGVRVFLDGVLEGARTTGYVQTLMGRRRYVPDVNSSNYQFRQAAEREAGNMPVQGTSADIIKLAMLRVDKALAKSDLSAKMILQVHDELLFESPPEEVGRLAVLIKEAMEAAYPLDVHLRADVKSGKNWWEVTPVESVEEAAFVSH